ncbi:MAG: hypothetical protein KatS3mg009_3153 [Acidimicrobiia bacterium]|nr:MAG: hypothetical protein KatS3mg009_3153 [Acidimicrobiia bacterium]
MIRDFGLLLAVGIAAICISLDRACRSPCSASASSATRRPAATGPTGRWPGCRPRSGRSRHGFAHRAGRSPLRRVRLRRIASRTTLEIQNDPPALGQPAQSQTIRTCATSRRRSGRRASSGCSCTRRGTSSATRSSSTSHRFTRETARGHPERAAHCARASRPPSATSPWCPAPPTSRRPAPTSSRLRGRTRATCQVRRVERRTERFNVVFRSGPVVPGGRGGRSSRTSATTPDRPGLRADALGPRRRRGRAPREPGGEPDRAHLPRDAASCSRSSRCASARCAALLSLVPVAIAVGMASIVA